MAPKFVSVTEALALSGVVNHDWCDEQSRWRGSEVHRACELLDAGKLGSCPDSIAAYLAQYKRFKRETHFNPTEWEIKAEDKTYGLRGRADRIGWLQSQRCILEIKTSRTIQPAVALQLALYGSMIDPNCQWMRVAVGLTSENYTVKIFDKKEWFADLATARACVRVASWKRRNA